jgi:hypothetical protein
MQDGALSEQSSLLAETTGDPAWLDRMVEFDPVARLGETFVLNSQVSDQEMPAARLVAGEALEAIGDWLADTLVPDVAEDSEAVSAEIGVDGVAHLSNAAAVRLVGLDPMTLPSAYRDWRVSVEIYVLVGDVVFLLLNHQFLRYRRLTSHELGMLLSPRTAPFMDFDDRITGTVVLVSVVPQRMAALGGLRGFRTALMHAGRATSALDHAWREAGVSSGTWRWHSEFFDDACCRVFGLDGVERVPMAIAYQAYKEAGQP